LIELKESLKNFQIPLTHFYVMPYILFPIIQFFLTTNLPPAGGCTNILSYLFPLSINVDKNKSI